ncbi:MAG: hypothetical protein ACRD10_02840 [Terriglobia bacterium]
MIGHVAQWVVQYAGYFLEIGLLGVLFRPGIRNRNVPLIAYVISFFAMDGVARPYALYHYGLTSRQYADCYWVTDVLLVLAAFMLICFLFRRASNDNEELWSYLRIILPSVFVLTAIVSCYSLSLHYDHLFTRFIVGFQQNLFFACLVLNTLLYVMLQYLESADEELNLIVCGMGIAVAGPAAGLALMYLTPGGQGAGSLFVPMAQLCNLGVFAMWLFAVTRPPSTQPAFSTANHGRTPVFAELPVAGIR